MCVLGCKLSYVLLLDVHKSSLLAKLLYGCHIYSTSAPSSLCNLDVVQHQGLCSSWGVFRNSPAARIYSESGVPSLAYCQSLHSLKHFAKLHLYPALLLLGVFPTVASVLILVTVKPPYLLRMQSLLEDTLPPYIPYTVCHPSPTCSLPSLS